MSAKRVSGRRDFDMQSFKSQQALWLKNNARNEREFDEYSEFKD